MIMLFKDCKFRDKKNVRKNMKEEIRNHVQKEVPYHLCNEGVILQYIDFLLDESKYNIRENTFYYQYRWVKIPLDSNILSKVAAEYIMEHLDEFLLMKNKL